MNRLRQAASPYLLQHKDNPVDWWEWSEEAFAEARATNRPVLLSIGYAACHWCHVMAHESFEDPATAAVMNELFVNIKVDREERPDIDHVYMSALHALGEQGGWPLTMFLDAEKAPFWGGTYFPPTARYGRPAFTSVLRQLSGIYASDRLRIARNARAIAAALKSAPEPALGVGEPDLDQIAVQLGERFDPRHGGLSGAPKFPNTGLIELLWRHGERSGDPASRDRVAITLTMMARGGIHDHLGGGFARYAVDERWLVPHFEKMLYDNAQLLPLYAVQAKRGDELAGRAANGIVTWLAREMRLPGGAFAASLDADSDGEEGRFYVWSPQQLREVLTDEDAALIARHYDVSDGGNWEGKSILNRLDGGSLSVEETGKIDALLPLLLAHRDKRVRPELDDKILADWNGLTIAALARSAGLLDRPDWLELATAAFRFVDESMADGDGLAHAFRAGRLIAPGFALDHAAMIEAALALHDATGTRHYFDRAVSWSVHLMRYYRDDGNGLLRMTRVGEPELPVIPRPTHDDAVPNAIGVQAVNLLRISAQTGNASDRTEADRFLGDALAAALTAPLGHASILNAYDLARNGIEIVLAGAQREAFRAAALALPFQTTIIVDCPDEAALPEDHPAAAYHRHAGNGAAFICRHGRCLPPVTDPNRLAEAIREI